MKTSDMIKKLCNKKNISVSELARRIGQSPQNFGKKMKRDTVTLSEMMQIADVMDVTFEQSFIMKNGESITIGNDNYISLMRVVKCPYCGADNAIDFEDYITNKLSYKRQMGPEIEHASLCEDYECELCGKQFTIEGNIHEYPVGAYDSERIDVKGE